MLKKILHANITETFTEGQWVSAAWCLIRSSLIAIGFLPYVQPGFHWSHSTPAVRNVLNKAFPAPALSVYQNKMSFSGGKVNPHS